MRLSSHFALALALVLAAALALASCAGGVDVLVRSDSSARISVRMEVPEALSQRVRQFGQIPQGTPLFDAVSLRKEFGARKTIHLIDVAVPDGDSMTSVLWIPDLKAFSADRKIAPEGMVSYAPVPAEGDLPAGKELKVRLSRENAAAAFALFPGMNRRLVDSLSPPALEPDPVSSADYRMNLETVILGKKAMPAFNSCVIEVAMTAPKSIVAHSGGTASGQAFKARLALFDLLTLEKPLEFSMRWAE